MQRGSHERGGRSMIPVALSSKARSSAPPQLSLRRLLRRADRLVGGRAATRAAAVRCGRWRKGQPDSERTTAGARGAMSGDGCGA